VTIMGKIHKIPKNRKSTDDHTLATKEATILHDSIAALVPVTAIEQLLEYNSTNRNHDEAAEILLDIIGIIAEEDTGCERRKQISQTGY